MRTKTHHLPDIDICFDDWEGDGRPVIFLHATGFSRGCWRPMAAALAERCRPILVDLPGHGGSSGPATPVSWGALADSVGSLIQEQGWENALLVGHSVGGATAVEIAGRIGASVAGVVLVEPVVIEPDRTTGGGANGSPLLERTRQRRAVWATRDEAVEYLAGRAPYSLWARPVFESWVETGIIPRDGEWGLSCPPSVEADIFETTGGSRAADYLPLLRCPVWLCRATGSLGMRTTCAPSVARRIPSCMEFVIPGSGHFLPLQYPEFVVSLVMLALEELDGASPA